MTNQWTSVNCVQHCVWSFQQIYSAVCNIQCSVHSAHFQCTIVYIVIWPVVSDHSGTVAPFLFGSKLLKCTHLATSLQSVWEKVEKSLNINCHTFTSSLAPPLDSLLSFQPRYSADWLEYNWAVAPNEMTETTLLVNIERRYTEKQDYTNLL